MLRLKSVFVVFWAALWLVGAMHCSLEALGVFANDHCCVASTGSADDSGCPGKSGCSYEESVSLLSVRADDVTPAPGPLVSPALLPAAEPSLMVCFKRARLNAEPAVLLQSWQFLWRTALVPRAPSVPA